LVEGQIYYEAAKTALTSNKKEKAEQYVDKSLRFLEEALTIAPDDALTLIWKAKSKRLEYDITQNSKYLDEAITIVTKIVGQESLNKTLKARASFNAACYHCLKKSELQTVLKYLKQALDFNPSYADSAQSEPDFESIRSHAAFTALFGVVP
jgi:tetratricopeptide (TPR) repeat protein